MHITQVKRTKKKIIVAYTTDGEERVLRAPENPMPAFHGAFDALSALVCEICHLPSSYASGLIVTELKLTDKGNELVSFRAAKTLDDSSDTFRFATPNRLTDQPKEEGTYSPPLSESQVSLIRELIDEAAAYVKGERAQGQIHFPGGEDDEDGDGDGEADQGDVLQFSESAATGTGEPAKPERPRKAK